MSGSRRTGWVVRLTPLGWPSGDRPERRDRTTGRSPCRPAPNGMAVRSQSWLGDGAWGARMAAVPFVEYPLPPLDPAFELVTTVLDPVLTSLGFARGQAGASAQDGQVIFCRGYEHSTDDGCIDLVVDLAATPDWRITAVRYWGYPAERWHLPLLRDGDLAAQLAQLSRTLHDDLT
jgi:hypothetical protein